MKILLLVVRFYVRDKQRQIRTVSKELYHDVSIKKRPFKNWTFLKINSAAVSFGTVFSYPIDYSERQLIKLFFQDTYITNADCLR